MAEVFQNIAVTLVRPDRIDPDGLCFDMNPQDDFKSLSLKPGNRNTFLVVIVELGYKSRSLLAIDFSVRLILML